MTTMQATVLAHGGAAGLLVESLILVVPMVILCLFMLATRKPRKPEGPDNQAGKGEVDG